MKEYLRRLFAYNSWANEQLIVSLKKVETVPEEILKLINHIYAAQTLWLSRIKNEHYQTVVIWPQEDFEQLRNKIEVSDKEWIAFVSQISEERIEQILKYVNTKGDSFSSKIGDIILHVVNHSSHHRGQITAFMRRKEIVPPDIDYIIFTRKVLPVS